MDKKQLKEIERLGNALLSIGNRLLAISSTKEIKQPSPKEIRKGKYTALIRQRIKKK